MTPGVGVKTTRPKRNKDPQEYGSWGRQPRPSDDTDLGTGPVRIRKGVVSGVRSLS